MANFEKALVEMLKDVTPNVYPLVAKEGVVAPYIVYESSYGERDYALEGHLVSREIDVTLYVIGGTYEEMKTITNNAYDLILSWQGQSIGTDAVTIQAISYDNPSERIDPMTYESVSICDFTFRI